MKSKKAKLEAPMSQPNDYQSEEDFRTLVRAEEIKEDKERLKKAQKHAKKQKRAISSIADLKEAYAESIKEEELE